MKPNRKTARAASTFGSMARSSFTGALWLIGAALAIAQDYSNDRSVGVYRGETTLGNQPIIVELDVSARSGPAEWKGDVTVTAKGNGETIGRFVMRGWGRNFSEPRKRSDRTPVLPPMRELEFSATSYSDAFGGRIRIVVREQRQNQNPLGTLSVEESRGGEKPVLTAPVTFLMHRSEEKKPEEMEGASAPAEKIDPADINGVYDGTFVADKHQYTLEMRVTREGDKDDLTAVFDFYAGPVTGQPLGTYKITGKL
jgi:hypothetical protein